MRLTPEEIKQIIAALPKRRQALSSYTPAAVLMIFFERDNATYLVYLRRTQGMIVHSGHIAFPGGKIDPDDQSSRAAAFRETWEEIGVDANALTYLGDLGLFETITSRFDAAAHAVWSPHPVSYRINPREVAEVVEIPLAHLFSQFRPEIDFGNYHDFMYLNFNYRPPNSTNVANLWGLTARITHHFLSGVHQQLPRLRAV
jgi:8-oxo-dGTP pyrophosphatase MutT (NUDIX family)